MLATVAAVGDRHPMESAAAKAPDPLFGAYTHQVLLQVEMNFPLYSGSLPANSHSRVSAARARSRRLACASTLLFQEQISQVRCSPGSVPWNRFSNVPPFLRTPPPFIVAN